MKKVPQYNPAKVEKKWQKQWEQDQLYRADDASSKPKFYQLETFPYPSAAGLHVGHPKGYIAEDIHARYQRMLGREVLYTMGWDAFGLPTENYAIKVGKTPKEVAKENIKNFKRQVQMFGLSYDWNREINTSSPEYYRWTQWLFIQLYKKGLAYRKKAKINWCSKDQTVLANEQVVDGCCERCGTVVEQREMEQWFFKITDYADRLLEGLEHLDWPTATKKRQEDWIGKSEGAIIEFALAQIPGQEDGKHKVQVFTTRPDTLFGATFLVISPELAQKWIEVGWQASESVKDYIAQSLRKRELERMEAREKTGVDTGVVAINPANQTQIPVWIADYVLGGYGTGAIMAVPAHDERDFEFAKKFGLKIQHVIKSDGEGVYIGSGELINSGQFDGLTSEDAKTKITMFVKGELKTQYRIRDWSVSRQRYWGVPIPMIYCPTCGTVPVPEEDLPVKLPDLVDYRPTGIPPLASSKDFIEVACPTCGGAAKRDSETLDTFVDSSWYYLRYTDPHNEQSFAAKANIHEWMPVQLYVIGAEHTNLHLLYARFITKFLNEAGCLDFKEPFLRLRHVGLIRGADGQKMSKSKGNVVNPDEIVGEYGADTVRLYEMFMGPFEDGQPWDPKGVLGVHRFLHRVWKFVHEHAADNVVDDSREVQTALHQTIKSVGEDIAGLRFNTAVSGLMKLLNVLETQAQVSGATVRALLTLLAPLAPHMSEELWCEVLHQQHSVHKQAWPKYDPTLLVSDTIQIPVQINGKTRAVITVARGSDDAAIETTARQDGSIARYLADQAVRKVIVVPGKLINFVL